MRQTGPIATLNGLFFHHLDHFRHDRLLAWERAHERVEYSTERFAHSVFALRSFLRSCGLAEGDRVAIFAENRPEWHIADFAILLARQIVVPVYPTLAPGQVEYLLANSGCRAAVISGEPQWRVLAPMLSRLPELQWIASMDDSGAGRACLPRIAAEAPAIDQAAREEIRAASLSVDPQSTATIVYTSGTTGRPKGVMLSHANLVFDLEQCLERFRFRTTERALSVLPLPHIFERLLCYGYFRMGVPIAYGDPHQLRDLLKRHRPLVMGAVPRILEKIREAIESEIELLPSWKRAVARWLLQSAQKRARRSCHGERDSSPAAWLPALAQRLLAARIRRQLGGLEYFICGGAWLDPDLELFFRGAGLVVLQGYGMTETSPVISLSELGKEKPGAVGRPLDGVELRLSDDGEIMTRGPHVMLGYHNDPEATRQAFRDGWLLTGDLGVIDAEGFLRITGRCKEMLVLSNGKNVSCASLEQALGHSHLIQQAFVVGEGRKFTSALLVPHLPNVARRARERGIPFQHAEELLLAAPVWSLFREELEAHQAQFSNYERVKRFCFLREEALLDPELVTPTQKMRRDVLERKYAGWIGQMYLEEDPLLIPLPGRNPEKQAAPA